MFEPRLKFNTTFEEQNDGFDDFEQAIPLMSEEEERRLSESEIPENLPILPLKNTVLFPGVVVPITVGRDRSLALGKEAYESDKTIGVVAQKDESIESPGADDLYEYGTVAQILKLIKMPDGSKSIVIQGKSIFKTDVMLQEERFFRAAVSPVAQEMNITDVELDAAIRSVKDTATKIVNPSPNMPSEAALAINTISSPTFLLNVISSNLHITAAEKQVLLELSPFSDRLETVKEQVNKELELLRQRAEIRSKVRADIGDQQR